MGGANLEVFKFGFYMFFPIYIMFKFGDPDWYDEYVLPYKDKLWPDYETTHKPPKNQADLQTELAKMRARHEAKRMQAQGGSTLDTAQSTPPTPPTSSVLNEVESQRTKPDWAHNGERLV